MRSIIGMFPTNYRICTAICNDGSLWLLKQLFKTDNEGRYVLDEKKTPIPINVWDRLPDLPQIPEEEL